MSAPVRPAGPSDHAVEQLVGRVLQVGVLVAAATVLAGAALMLARGGSAPACSPWRASGCCGWYLAW